MEIRGNFPILVSGRVPNHPVRPWIYTWILDHGRIWYAGFGTGARVACLNDVLSRVPAARTIPFSVAPSCGGLPLNCYEEMQIRGHPRIVI